MFGILDERVVRAVQLGRAVFHRLFGIEDGGQHFVADLDPATALLGGADRIGDHRDDPLASESHDVVEDQGVVGIDEMVGVDRCVEPLPWDVFPGVDAVHAGHRQRGGLVDRHDAGMRVR